MFEGEGVIDFYRYNDLNGKILKITVNEEDGVITVLGRDVETGDVYVVLVKEV